MDYSKHQKEMPTGMPKETPKMMMGKKEMSFMMKKMEDIGKEHSKSMEK